MKTTDHLRSKTGDPSRTEWRAWNVRRNLDNVLISIVSVNGTCWCSRPGSPTFIVCFQASIIITFEAFSRWWAIKHLNILSEFPFANIWTSEHSWRGKILSREQHRTSLSPPKKFGSTFKVTKFKCAKYITGQVYLFRHTKNDNYNVRRTIRSRSFVHGLPYQHMIVFEFHFDQVWVFSPFWTGFKIIFKNLRIVGQIKMIKSKNGLSRDDDERICKVSGCMI